MATISSLVVTDVPSHHRHNEEANTPTTPKAPRQLSVSTAQAPTPPSTQVTESTIPGSQPAAESHLTSQSTPEPSEAARRDSDSMDVDDLDKDDPDSDGEDEAGDGDTASRKKKGQRFFCTGYPPCNLSFTRSEHLARHIRKHTGERPFQCHCNRRFSRLDNLRQHAQTVHVNEEIPTDSLAATGTRFQRTIRTEKIPRNPRPRSSTMSSTGSQSRGHSRNVSASSIGSTSSNYSTVTEAKRRPPPLLMANDASRPKLGIEPPSTPPGQYHGPHSPGGFSTPTSATYPVTPGSPGYGSSFGSPMSSASRMYGPRTPGRRLSVPSGPNPFQAQYQAQYQPSPYNQMGPPISNSSANQTVFASPTSATFNVGPGFNVIPSEDPRRRTWHPGTWSGTTYGYARPATSGLLYSQTPDAPHPAYAQHAQAAAGQTKLPGIESFDHFQHRPSSPPKRQSSPMHLDHTPTRQSMYPDLDDHSQIRSVSWGQQTIDDIRRVSAQPSHPARTDMGPPPPILSTSQQQQQIAQEALQVHTSSKRVKRQGWVGPAGARTSPEDSSSSDGIPTPRTSAADVHPMIMPAGGYMDSQHPMMASENQNTVRSSSSFSNS